MDKKDSSTSEKSKKEITSQVYFPIALVLILFVVSIILIINVSGTGNSSIQQWANISIIILVIPVLFQTLLLMALAVLVILGQGKLIKWIPIHFANIYVFIIKIFIILINGTNRIIKPIINVEVMLYSVSTFFKKGQK